MKGLGSIKFGEVIIKILSDSPAMTVAELHFPSGVSADVHHHINEEANYVVEGVFETPLNNELTTFSPGDLLHIESNKNHSLKCISEENGVILTVWTPSRKDLISKLKEA